MDVVVFSPPAVQCEEEIRRQRIEIHVLAFRDDFVFLDLMAIKAENPCSHSHCIHWRFIQFVALMLTAMSTTKRSKSSARQFQELWTADVGFVSRNGRAVCTLVQDDSEKNHGFKKAVSRYENRVAFQKSRSQCKSKYGK